MERWDDLLRTHANCSITNSEYLKHELVSTVSDVHGDHGASMRWADEFGITVVDIGLQQLRIHDPEPFG